MRRSQIQSEMLRYILIAVVAFVIIVFSIMIFKNLRDRQREADIIDFKNDIANSIEVIATRYGSVEKKTMGVGEDTEVVCFLDLSHSDDILETPLVDTYPLIGESLETEAEQNVFWITGYDVTDAFYQEDLCFEDYPYYQCVTVEGDSIDIFLEGLGNCATIYTNTSGFISYNVRNYDKYAEGFLIEAESNNQNYQDILKVVYIAFVNSKDEGYTQYPFLSYYGNIDSTDIDDIMDEKEIESIVIFTDGSITYTGSNTVIVDSISNIMDYWTTIYDVTIVGTLNTDAHLIASLFAAYTNTPLIFIDNSNLAEYEDLLTDKTVNAVDEDEIDSLVIDFIEENSAPRYFNSNDLKVLRQNKVLELESGIIII